MTKVLLVEDEPVIAARLLRLLPGLLALPSPTLIWLENIDDALDYISNNTIDLLLLDLNLHGADGFELLQDLVAGSFHTIIVSAHSERALTAFDYGVLDFVPKPFTQQRLSKALARFTEYHRETNTPLKHLAIKKPQGLQLVSIAEVTFIKADGHYTQLHFSNRASALYSKSIDRLLTLLPPSFVRVHRSYVVNLNCIHRLQTEPGGLYTLQLTYGQDIPVSRTRFKQVKALFVPSDKH